MENNWTNRLTLGTPRGDGDLLHNTRKLATGGVRQRGDTSRHDWNVYLVNKTLEEAYGEKFGPALAAYNERMLQQGRKNRCKTMDEWMSAQLTKKEKGAAEAGSKKRGYDEVIIRFGNMFTACPYVYKTNDKGEPVDEEGKVIQPWDTRKRPVPVLDEHGNKIKSVRYYRLVNALTKCLEKFQETYPELVVINASIHADEAGIHMHVDYIYCYEINNGIGLGCSYSTGLSRICDRLGIKYDAGKKKDCALAHWQRHLRKTLIAYMPELGLEWVDGKQSGRKKLKQEAFEMFSDYRSEVIEKQAKVNEAAAIRNTHTAKRLSNQEKIISSKESRIKEKEAVVIIKQQELADKEKALFKKEQAIASQKTMSETMRQNAMDLLQEAKEKTRKADEYSDREHAKWKERLDKAEILCKSWETRTADIDKRQKAVVKREESVSRKEMKLKELKGKQEFVVKNMWIIGKVLEEHPEWLQEKRQEAEIVWEAYKQKQREMGLRL